MCFFGTEWLWVWVGQKFPSVVSHSGHSRAYCAPSPTPPPISGNGSLQRAACDGHCQQVTPQSAELLSNPESKRPLGCHRRCENQLHWKSRSCSGYSAKLILKLPSPGLTLGTPCANKMSFESVP